MVYGDTDSKVPLGMLPEIYQELVHAVGMEVTLKLGREFGGMSLYLPKIETSLREWRDENIRREFTGANVRQLARKYRLTGARIRQILGGGRER